MSSNGDGGLLVCPQTKIRIARVRTGGRRVGHSRWCCAGRPGERTGPARRSDTKGHAPSGRRLRLPGGGQHPHVACPRAVVGAGQAVLRRPDRSPVCSSVREMKFYNTHAGWKISQESSPAVRSLTPLSHLFRDRAASVPQPGASLVGRNLRAGRPIGRLSACGTFGGRQCLADRPAGDPRGQVPAVGSGGAGRS